MVTSIKEPSSERLVARLSASDKALFEEAAEREGRSLSSFVVTHLREHSRNVIEEHAKITLNEEESRRFHAALQSPAPEATPTMLKAIEASKDTISDF
ncbi:DUF1778 domain-containing protein [Verrucomicrobiales bacterium]|nr:DUF1778 domain-containing protein [Verrucomicrobiales bacterium]